MNKIIWIGLIIAVLTLIFFVVLMPVRVIEHQIITTPYEVTEPYNAKERYTVEEPYTYSYTECVDHSFWTGDCVEYDRRYATKYRTVTKHNVEHKDVKLTKFATLFQMVNGKVDWYYEVQK